MKGEVRISGSKNAGLALMAASVLCYKPTTLIGLPNVKDMFSMTQLLLDLGSKVSFDATQIEKYGPDCSIMTIDNSNINKLVDIPVRERIGRYKYTPEADLDSVYKDIIDDLNAQIEKVIKEKEDF